MALLTEESEPETLKTDVLGRVWTPRERRAQLLAKFESSAMSAAEFARASGVKYATFAGWVAKERKARRLSGAEVEAPREPSPMRWAEAVCENGSSGKDPAVVVHLGGGIRVEARDGRVAAELLVAMGVRGC